MMNEFEYVTIYNREKDECMAAHAEDVDSDGNLIGDAPYGTGRLPIDALLNLMNFMNANIDQYVSHSDYLVQSGR